MFQDVECWVCGSSPSLANFHNHSPDLGCYQGATIHNAVKGNITVAMSVASGPSGNPFILGSFLVEIGQKLGDNKFCHGYCPKALYILKMTESPCPYISFQPPTPSGNWKNILIHAFMLQVHIRLLPFSSRILCSSSGSPALGPALSGSPR